LWPPKHFTLATADQYNKSRTVSNFILPSKRRQKTPLILMYTNARYKRVKVPSLTTLYTNEECQRRGSWVRTTCPAAPWPGIELATSLSQVRRLTVAPPRHPDTSRLFGFQADVAQLVSGNVRPRVFVQSVSARSCSFDAACSRTRWTTNERCLETERCAGRRRVTCDKSHRETRLVKKNDSANAVRV